MWALPSKQFIMRWEKEETIMPRGKNKRVLGAVMEVCLGWYTAQAPGTWQERIQQGGRMESFSRGSRELGDTGEQRLVTERERERD